MTNRVTAKIHWISANEGGRTAPPSGYRYSTVASFGEEKVEPSQPAWSLLIESAEPLNASDCVTATVQFLVPDKAPNHLLYPGQRFRLLEGKRTVATGEVLDTERNQRSNAEVEALIQDFESEGGR